MTRVRQNAYVEWIVTPKAERDPSTKQELAEELGVTTVTLRNYARDPRVQREIQKRQKGLIRVERANDVLDSLYRQAVDVDNPRSVTAAKTLLEWMDRTLDVVEELELETMSNEELARLVDELMDAVEERGVS